MTTTSRIPRGAELLFDAARIEETVDRLGDEIQSTYGDEEVTAVVVMRGGLVFAADLIRRLEMPLRLDFVHVSSYHGTQPGALAVQGGFDFDLTDRHVLIIEDILDTGRTLKRICELAATRSPRSLRTVTLLDKPSRRAVDFEPDFTGFTIPDKFVVGYGLDYNERWRNLRDIVALDPQDLPE